MPSNQRNSNLSWRTCHKDHQIHRKHPSYKLCLYLMIMYCIFLGSRKGRCNYQRKHEYIMRSRSLAQNIKQIRPTNAKASRPSVKVLSPPDVSTHPTNLSPGGGIQLVDFAHGDSIPPQYLEQAKDGSTEFTQEQPLNLSKKRQNEIIRPDDGMFPSNIQI